MVEIIMHQKKIWGKYIFWLIPLDLHTVSTLCQSKITPAPSSDIEYNVNIIYNKTGIPIKFHQELFKD